MATVAIIAALCCVVLLTTGRTAGAENAVLTSIDTTGTRSIVVRASAASGLDTTVLHRLENVGSIEWAGAFGPASDVVNAAFAGGNRVPLRVFHPGSWGDPTRGLAPAAGVGTVSAAAARALGLSDGVGTVVPVAGGAPTDVIRAADPPSFLQFLEPTVLVPSVLVPSDSLPTVLVPAPPAPTDPQSAPVAPPQPVAVLVVLARTAAQVSALATVVASVLDVRDTSTVTLTTSEQLAALRAVVQQQLGTFGQSLVAIVFGGAALVVGGMLHALVMLRRKDYGRRRALGATRMLVVELLLVQVALLAGVGAALGSGAASVALIVLGDPLPTAQFFGALAVLATLAGVVSAVVPAIAASRRDPLRELRVP